VILSVDPGLRHCGFALWWANGPNPTLPATRLFYAGLATGAEGSDSPHRAVAQAVRAAWQSANIVGYEGTVTTVVLERPQVYQKSPGDPNDLIDLALVDGALLGLFPAARAVLYKPAEWKKQLPKEITSARARAALEAAGSLSRVVLPTKSLQHNVWDAVGIGLYHLTHTHR